MLSFIGKLSMVKIIKFWGKTFFTRGKEFNFKPDSRIIKCFICRCLASASDYCEKCKKYICIRCESEHSCNNKELK